MDLFEKQMEFNIFREITKKKYDIPVHFNVPSIKFKKFFKTKLKQKKKRCCASIKFFKLYFTHFSINIKYYTHLKHYNIPKLTH